jgi:hypothetical protein
MKLFSILLLLVVTVFEVKASTMELFPPVDGAVRYEVKVTSATSKKSYLYRSKKTTIDTKKLPAGTYQVKARYQFADNSWSPWSQMSTLKVIKKIRPHGVVELNEGVYTEKMPVSLGFGLTSLQNTMTGEDKTSRTQDTALRIRGSLQRNFYKFGMIYDGSEHFSRYDTFALKMINNHLSLGVNFWMMNYKEGDLVANYSQLFLEANYSYPIGQRFIASLRSGVSLSLGYHIKPEVIYQIPLSEDFLLSTHLSYEQSEVSQSGYRIATKGLGALVNLHHFIEF